MNTTISCRHLTTRDLYRTILLEEGCDPEARRTSRPASATLQRDVTVYSAEASRWVPRFRVLFGDSMAG